MQYRRASALTAGVIAFVTVVSVAARSGGTSPDAAVQVREVRERAAITSVERLTLPQMVSVLRAAGWPESEIPEAIDVAGCESDWRPDAFGSHGERGLFQIHPMNSHRFEISGVEVNPEDPFHNAAAALAIWELYGWEPWTCQPED
jgi:hypothetical protein